MASTRSRDRREDAALTAAVEDALKAIYAIGQRSDAAVSTTAIAERLGVSAATASGMVKRLAEQGLVVHRPYRGVSLSEEGRRAALEVMRHHRLIEAFLADLGMPWDRIHGEAEVLEHVISEELEALIARRLGDPTHDPHGDPIPSADLEIEEAETRSLSAMDSGEHGTFVRVSDSDPGMLRYLARIEVSPGDPVEIVDRQPFGGPLTVRFPAGERALGGELAEAMRIASR